MTFLQPAFLWGLIALAVPIIVHFFYLRRSKRYVFTQTRLLEKLVQASRPYLRLNHLILLLMRLLIVVVLVFLFAKPLWDSPGAGRSGKISALILVDVSPSMREKLPGGIAFLKGILSKEKGLEEAKVLATDRLYAEGRFRSVRECLEVLSEIRPADMGYPLSQILQNGEMHFSGAQGERRRVYILSDFQASSVGDVAALPREIEYVLIPMPLNLSDNAYVDSVGVRLVGGQRLLVWHLRGDSGKSYTIRRENVPIVASPGWREVSWPVSQSYVKLEVAGDKVSFDNRFVVGAWEEGERSMQMSLIGGGGIPAAFERLGRLLGVSLQQGWKDSAQVGVWVDRLSEDGRWMAWVEKGRVLVVFPPAGLTLSAWNQSFLGKRVELMGTAERSQSAEGLRPLRHELWEGVFQERPAGGLVPALFRTKRLYQFRAADAYPLLSTDGGEALLWEIPWGEGRVYLFTFPWGEANFGEQSLFPVFFERLYALQGQRKAEVGAFFLGKPHTFVLTGEEGPVRLRQMEGDLELIPPQRQIGSDIELQVGGYPMPAGLYEVYAGARRVGYLGANISPEESSAGALDLKDWEAMGLDVRVIVPEGAATLRNDGWALRWRWWQLWGGLAVVLLLLEAWWAKRLLRAPRQVRTPFVFGRS